MARAIKLGTDGTVTEVDVRPDYPELNKNFGDDALIQKVAVPRITDRFGEDHIYGTMLVDEEGSLKGLLHNEAATRLYVAYPYRETHHVLGDALLIGVGWDQRDESETFTDLPENITVEAITGLLSHFQEF